MTPGSYLRDCREKAGVSVELLAAKVITIPHATAEHERLDWLRRIEADDAPITADIADAYCALVVFDAIKLTMLLLEFAGLSKCASVEHQVADVLDLALDQRLPPAIGAAA